MTSPLVWESIKAAERERIAVAIETYLDPTDCGNNPTCEGCALVRQLAIVARAGGKPPEEKPHDAR